MVLDALLTEGVKTGQRLGRLEGVQTNLADEKLILYLLSKFSGQSWFTATIARSCVGEKGTQGVTTRSTGTLRWGWVFFGSGAYIAV